MIRSPCFRPLAVVALAASLSACGSSVPLRYHTLSLPGAATPARGSAAMLVEVLPIAVPERINREDLVLTAPGGQLDVRDGDRWAAPLGDEIRQLVDDSLWRRLRAADTYAAPVTVSADGLPQYRLALRLERLEAISGQRAVTEATWTLRRLPQGKPVICRALAVEPLMAMTADAAVAALSATSAQVSEVIAASLERLHGGVTDPCGGEG